MSPVIIAKLILFHGSVLVEEEALVEATEGRVLVSYERGTAQVRHTGMAMARLV